ncbi:MAG: pyrrolo-quinoline quinone, partial [Alphaproteobacteria bacterium]
NLVDDKTRRKQFIVWTGPVLAGDRLIVTGSHGKAVSISPYTGKALGEIKTNEGILIQPVVANNTIYFLDDGGRLTAMR